MKNYERQTLRFSDLNAVSIATFMQSGELYSDWPEMNSYLNKVLQRVIPDALKGEKMIQAYLVKDGSFNAHMSVTGQMFINVGVFGFIEDEATLASIMAHEIGHYFLNHNFEKFVKNQNRAFERRLTGRQVDYFEFSVNNELDCDSLSLNWLEKAGYNFNSAVKMMESLKQIEENQIMRLKDVWEITKSTHPKGEKRVGRLQELATEMATNPLSDFIIGEQVFLQLQNEAKIEIVKLLLHDFNYTQCIETAFKFHLEAPQNTAFLYYLMEGIRRAGTLQLNFWNKKFIIHQYYEVLGENQKKVKINKHLFEEFFPNVLRIPPSKFEELPANHYWQGEPKFITNEQAFEYFATLGEQLHEPECLFSNALSMSFDPETYQPLLNQYLTYDSIRYKDYAEHMLQGTLQSSLPDNAVAFVDEFNPSVRQRNEILYIREESATSSHPILEKQFAPAFGNYSQFVYLPNLIDNQLNDYNIIEEMVTFSRSNLMALSQRSLNQKADIHLLDPRFWEIMKKYKANEFDFVAIDLRDVGKNKQTLETYQHILNLHTKRYLQAVKRDRYVIISTSSLRFKQNKRQRIFLLSGQVNLKYNQPVFPQLNRHIIRELKYKNQQIQESDKRR